MPKPDETVYTTLPTVVELGTLYRISHHSYGRRYDAACYANILVNEETRVISLEDWFWFGVRPVDKSLVAQTALRVNMARTDVIEWLRDWRLIEPRGGPDSEYIATDKLVGGSKTLEV